MKTHALLNLTVTVLAVLAGLAPAAAQDLKFTKRITAKMPEEMAGLIRKAEGKDDSDSMEMVVYFKGGRMRTDQLTKEYNFIGMSKKRAETEIRLCELKQTLFFDSKEKTYSAAPFTPAEEMNRGPGGKARGVVTIIETVTDTGERQEMFGFQARHVKTVMVFKAGKGSCMEEFGDGMTIEKDGWYADIPGFSCPDSGSLMPDLDMECEDRYEHRITGKAESGFALRETTAVRMGMMPAVRIVEEVVSVDRSPLPESLFGPPAGYRPAK